MNKYWKYLKYVLRHKWFVMIECFKHGLIWRGIMHDMSKFKPSEFIPYAKYFYGDYGVQNKCPAKWADIPSIFRNTKANMDRAWLQHMQCNDHHWQHWVLPEDSGDTFCLEMPKKVVIEMVCDWIGAGKAQHSESNCFGWYMQNKAKMKFAPETRDLLERLINKKEEFENETEDKTKCVHCEKLMDGGVFPTGRVTAKGAFCSKECYDADERKNERGKAP